ncbi:RNA methyltransferase, TrmH family [hydrothermal vent metagenome]|uniref:RNA methyltransferase, TrmH family n=1 Tax=hydrothermal vent metagenome TaxID=652676 RepID=A0A3B0T1K2_9ZZZZ
MVVKNQIKLIKSLQQKKCRIQHGLFVVEGIKTVQEISTSDFKAYKIYSTDLKLFDEGEVEVELISQAELKQMSGLKTPNTVLGVFYAPKLKELDFEDWILVLDDIRDPGNLGTIIRLCDWFGIQHIVCSHNTVDCYNPKVLQATMGSIVRVNMVYADLDLFLKNVSTPVYGAYMDGVSIYNCKLPKKGILILGNEANGISEEVEKTISQKISILQSGSITTESLNVATAAAILLNEVRRP